MKKEHKTWSWFPWQHKKEITKCTWKTYMYEWSGFQKLVRQSMVVWIKNPQIIVLGFQQKEYKLPESMLTAKHISENINTLNSKQPMQVLLVFTEIRGRQIGPHDDDHVCFKQGYGNRELLPLMEVQEQRIVSLGLINQCAKVLIVTDRWPNYI